MAACASRTALTIQVQARCTSTDALAALESKSVPSPGRPQKQRKPRVLQRTASARARAVTRVRPTRGRSRMPSSLSASLADVLLSDIGMRLLFLGLRPHRQQSCMKYASLVSPTPSSDQTCGVAGFSLLATGARSQSRELAHSVYIVLNHRLACSVFLYESKPTVPEYSTTGGWAGAIPLSHPCRILSLLSESESHLLFPTCGAHATKTLNSQAVKVRFQHARRG